MNLKQQEVKIEEAENHRGEFELKSALEALYPEIRKLAGRVLKRERHDHTLQKTALANEAILKLLGSEALQVQDAHHLLAISARHMRHILVDYGRAKVARKRGGGAQRVELQEGELRVSQDVDGLLALNDGLEKLGEEDERALRVVELKYFTGFTTPETAQILGLSAATVEKIWHDARIWLHSRLTESINRGFSPGKPIDPRRPGE